MSESPQNPPRRCLGQGDFSATNLLLLALLTVLAFLVMGYHPGLEDDAFYLAAIKRNLNPALFPHDAEFFRLQFQATVFDKLIARSVRLSHVPLAWAILLWQFAAIFFLLHGCWRISRRCFSQPHPQWAAVATVAVLLTLPVSGVGITLADQYLHPRTLATAAILAAIVAVLDPRLWQPRFFRWDGSSSPLPTPGAKRPPLAAFIFWHAGSGMSGSAFSPRSCSYLSVDDSCRANSNTAPLC